MGGGWGWEVAPPLAGPAVVIALDGQVALCIFSYGEGGGTVLQLYVHDHTPFTKLQHVVSFLYNVHAYV